MTEESLKGCFGCGDIECLDRNFGEWHCARRALYETKMKSILKNTGGKKYEVSEEWLLNAYRNIVSAYQLHREGHREKGEGLPLYTCEREMCMDESLAFFSQT
jgi:hypothetical protein